MKPIFYIDWGFVQIGMSSYRAMLILAVVLAVLVLVFTAWHRHFLNKTMVLATLAAAFGAVIGARSLGTLNGGHASNGFFSLQVGGFSIWGGLIGGFLFISIFFVFYTKLLKNQATSIQTTSGEFFDVLAPATGVGLAVARGGCWFAGCCFGTPTTLPWAVVYPSGSHAHIFYMNSSNPFLAAVNPAPGIHPVPLYEIGASLLGVALAVYVWKVYVKPRKWVAGSSMAIFVAWYATWRAILEFVRYEEPVSLFSGLSWSLVFAIIAISAIGWLWIKNKPRPTQVDDPQILVNANCTSGEYNNQ